MLRKLAFFLLLTGIATAGHSEKTLVSFADKNGFPPEKIILNDAVAKPGNGTLSVTFGKTSSWPGITFSGLWDLSDDARVVMELVNKGTNPVRLELLLYDNPERSFAQSLHCAHFFAPGERWTFVLPLTHKGSTADAVIFDGMVQRPEGLPVRNSIDLKRVMMITLSKTGSDALDTIEIKEIRAEGRYQAVDTGKMIPLLDKYGQYRHGEWPGKIHNDNDLDLAVLRENADLTLHPAPAVFNQYGGWLSGPKLQAGGHFRTEKYNGKWYLVDPSGNLFFSLGINHVNIAGPGSFTVLSNERRKWFEAIPSPNDWSANGRFFNVREIYSGDYNGRIEPGFSFLAWNMARKYGSDWERKAGEMALCRLKSWGFNTIGNWSDRNIISRNTMPYTVGVALVGCGARPIGGFPWRMGKCWDVYDPEFAGYVEKTIAGLKNTASSPWCIGIFVDNELYWKEDFGLTALRSSASQPAKQAFIRDLQAKYGEISRLNKEWETGYSDWDNMSNVTVVPLNLDRAKVDLDAFYLKTAEGYFRTVRDSIRRQIPGCLYLGSRFAQVTPLAFKAAAKYCDVVSFNVYRQSLKGFVPPSHADVPLLVGEFHFGATDRGMWGNGLVAVKNQQERAEGFRAYVDSALTHPQFVGCHWFEYYDQPFAGRAFDGENYNIGFVNTVDIPYPELVAAARSVSASMYRTRNDAPCVNMTEKSGSKK